MKAVSSKSPRKQRKYRFLAPLHVKRRLLSAHLSKELRAAYNTRNIPIRKGDSIVVMRGKFKGTEGKIDKVYTKYSKVSVDTIKTTTKKGNKVPFKLRPSALMIKELNLIDNWRVKKLKEYGATR
jgi:large subunit ribosomal protein L24